MRIYRAPGSVAFLSCGPALQPILPKSQCWCIDELDTTYVLQVRRPTFWRIELPASTVEHQKLASDLRAAWQEVLQFEKTYCPFQRGFSVELPEKPETPVKKKPWKPKHSPLPLDKAEESEAKFDKSPRSTASDVGAEHNSTQQVAPPVQGEEPTKSRLEAHAAEGENQDIPTQDIPSSPPVTVASIVDDIHERFGRISNFKLPDTPHSGWRNTEDSHGVQSPRLPPRRHSFDTFTKAPVHMSEEVHDHPLALDDTAMDSRPTIFKLSSHFADLPNQSTRVPEDSSSRADILQTPLTPPKKSLHSIRHGSTGDSVLNTAAVNGRDQGAHQLKDPEPSGVEGLFPGSTGAVDSRDSPTTPPSTAQAPSESQDTQSPSATGLRHRRTEVPHPSLSSSARKASGDSVQSTTKTSAQRDRHGLSMNVISQVYDALLLPLAYIIALLLRAVASVLFFRSKQLSSAVENDSQPPAFLHYSEDELSD